MIPGTCSLGLLKENKEISLKIKEWKNLSVM